jgi:uncharacterized protein YbjT (DUF2867 family)
MGMTTDGSPGLRAIVFGATGMVGEGVLHIALRHPGVESVLAVVRRPTGKRHPKLRELVHADFHDYAAIENRLAGYTACFFCLGVSSIGMNEANYTRVTYDLTMAAARTLARLNPSMTFCYVSGLGTDGSATGSSMWARVKGRTENELARLPFKGVFLFRPGFIKPIRGLEKGYRVSRILGTLYPVWRLFLPRFVCTLEDVGFAMIGVARGGYPKKILENPDIGRCAEATRRIDAGIPPSSP